MAFDLERWSLTTLFHYKSKIRREPVQKHRVSNPFHAVSVMPPLVGACDAAYKASGKRHLSTEAPSLPLKQCDAQHCTCRYKHHEDRRSGARRAADAGAAMAPWQGLERRNTGGRRMSDR